MVKKKKKTDIPYSVTHAAFEFVLWGKKFSEDPRPVHERWSDVLQFIPEARGERGIAGQYYDLYEAAYHGSIQEWPAEKFRKGAMELAMLQSRFFDMLYETGVVQAQSAEFHRDACVIWFQKLNDKYVEIMPAGWGRKNQFLPAIGADNIKHGWLH